MSSKIFLKKLTFSTDLTDEGPSPCVYWHVSCQVVVSIKNLSTFQAGERLGRLTSCGGPGERSSRPWGSQPSGGRGCQGWSRWGLFTTRTKMKNINIWITKLT